jgi:hypothetical protein
MSESAKTMTFIAVALVALLAGWASRPTSVDVNVASLRGENLTKGFTDPGEARRLKIVEFNEASATLREFEVAEEDGLWTIPSKNGYPADATRQMAEAATSLMDRKILAIASENAGDHEQFGVIDPLSPKLEVGQKGVGTRVTISDIQDKPLADLIIGREVKGTTSNQHYVREANRDVVYIVEIDPGRLSTNFADWIEKDLLKLNAWDIQDVQINDYTAELQTVMTPQGLAIQVAWDPRSELKLAYDDQASKWTPAELKEFDKGTNSYAEFQLSADEELNTEKLDALKTALDDLAIVDVDRKPAGLSANLKAGVDFLDNAEARKDLRSLGFATVPARDGSGGQELISSEGEAIVTMKDGVEYVLRFGDLRMDTSGQNAEHPAEATASEKSKAGDQSVQRYLFAMARFNEAAVAKPELEALPPLPEPESQEKSAEPTQDSDPASSLQRAGNPANTEEAEPETSQPETDKAETDQAEASKSETAKPETPEEKSPEYGRVLAERKRIETENQRKQDQYNALLEKGRQEVKDLNLRFGDWYFVVANDTFQKVRLGRNDVVRKKAANANSTSVDANSSAAGVPGSGLPGLPSIPGVSQ